MAVNRVSSEAADVEQLPKEKDVAVHDEYRRGGLSEDDLNFLDTFSEDRKKRVLRKVDVRS